MDRQLFVALADMRENAPLWRRLETSFGRILVATERIRAVQEMVAAGVAIDAAIVGVRERVDSEVLDALPNLAVLGSVGAGTNHLDLTALTQRGVAVITTPGLNAVSVAEHALAMILALAKRVRPAHAAVVAGLDRGGLRDQPVELRGMRAGILGAGATARALVPLLEAFGVLVDVWTRTPKRHPDLRTVRLESIFDRSDIVSIHLPLTAETRGLVTARLIERLPHGAMLINVARKEIVAHDDLVAGLRARPDLYIAIDDFELANDGTVGAVDESHSLFSPHMAGVTVQSLNAMQTAVVDGVLAYYEDGQADRGRPAR